MKKHFMALVLIGFAQQAFAGPVTAVKKILNGKAEAIEVKTAPKTTSSLAETVLTDGTKALHINQHEVLLKFPDGTSQTLRLPEASAQYSAAPLKVEYNAGKFGEAPTYSLERGDARALGVWNKDGRLSTVFAVDSNSSLSISRSRDGGHISVTRDDVDFHFIPSSDEIITEVSKVDPAKRTALITGKNRKTGQNFQRTISLKDGLYPQTLSNGAEGFPAASGVF